MGSWPPVDEGPSATRGQIPPSSRNPMTSLSGPLETRFPGLYVGVFRTGGNSYSDRLVYPPMGAQIFFRTFLRWFRVALPFIAWLVWWLVAKPKASTRKKLKKNIENWPWGGRAATVAPPFGHFANIAQ